MLCFVNNFNKSVDSGWCASTCEAMRKIFVTGKKPKGPRVFEFPINASIRKQSLVTFSGERTSLFSPNEEITVQCRRARLVFKTHVIIHGFRFHERAAIAELMRRLPLTSNDRLVFTETGPNSRKFNLTVRTVSSETSQAMRELATYSNRTSKPILMTAPYEKNHKRH